MPVTPKCHSNQKILSYTAQDYSFIMLLIIFFQQLLPWLRSIGQYILHLNHSVVYSYFGLGDLLRDLFFNQSVAIILMCIILSYHLQKTPNLDWRIIFTCTFLVTSISCSTIILNNNKFIFEGYTNLGTSILVYSCIALYLSFKLKEIPLLKKALIITLALLAVSHLWEMPFTLMGYLNSNSHLYYWLLGIGEWSIPIMFLFHACRSVYLTFIRQHAFILISLILAITLVTVSSIVFKLLGRFWMPIGFTLRGTYALLLVILPFHFYSKR